MTTPASTSTPMLSLARIRSLAAPGALLLLALSVVTTVELAAQAAPTPTTHTQTPTPQTPTVAPTVPPTAEASPAAGAGAAAVKPLTANTLTLAEGQSSPPATLRDVAWLTGTWRGDGFGGHSDEHWTAPAGSSMLGLYRLVQKNETVFSELMSIIEQQGTLVLKLKHFHPDLKGWEEKNEMVQFPLVRVSGDGVWFRGLTYARAGEDRMTISLALRGKDGVFREETFNFVRVR